MSVKAINLSRCYLGRMTTDELWLDVETWFDGIALTLLHRSYSEHSMTGVQSIQLDVRKHLTWIDQALREIEIRSLMKPATAEREQSGL